MASNAVRDPDTGKYFHEECAPDLLNLETVTVDGFVCEECGGPIDDDDEDDDETRSIEPEED